MIKPVINQFNGGEISPDLEGRFDWNKYNYSAKLCKNFIPQIEGSLKRRGGTHFVNKTEDTPSFKVKFSFLFNDSTTNDIQATFDDTTFVISETEYETNIELGDTLNYSFYVNNYIEVTGSVEVYEDKEILVNFINVNDAVTVNVTADPKDSTLFINGVETNSLIVERNTVVKISATYNNHTSTLTHYVTEDSNYNIVVNYVAYQTTRYEQTEIIKLNRGIYNVFAVGGSGGSGGGTYGDGHKSTGAGGGSGAFYEGQIKLEGEYSVTTGRWGAGGYSGNDKWDAGNGHDGTATIISGVISCGGGTGGARGGGKGSPDYYGIGGKFISYNDDIVLGSGVNGNDATRYSDGTNGTYTGTKRYYGGKSPTLDSKYDGASGTYKHPGTAGHGGYLKIVYDGAWE